MSLRASSSARPLVPTMMMFRKLRSRLRIAASMTRSRSRLTIVVHVLTSQNSARNAAVTNAMWKTIAPRRITNVPSEVAFMTSTTSPRRLESLRET